MRKIIEGLLQQTDIRFLGIAFILILFAVFSLALDLPMNASTDLESQIQNPDQTLPAEFRYQVATPTVEHQPALTPTKTPFPAELLANYQQTTGIIIFAGVVVLIIVGGVLSQLLQDRSSPT